jgi:hypothetical protein
MSRIPAAGLEANAAAGNGDAERVAVREHLAAPPAPAA